MSEPAKESAADHFVSLLQPGERLLWSGAPQPRPRFGAANAAVQVFATAAGLALAVIAIALGIGARSDPARLWFVLAALLLAGYCAALVAEARSAGSISGSERFFAVTDRRVLRYTPGALPPVDFLHLNARSPTRLAVHRDGTGTVAIGDSEDVLARLDLWFDPPFSKVDAGFYDVLPASVIVFDDVGEPFRLYSLIERVKHGERS